MAYAQLEPFGPLREDFRAGQVAASSGNAGRLVARSNGARFSDDPFEAGDFFDSIASQKRPSPEELGRKLRLWAA